MATEATPQKPRRLLLLLPLALFLGLAALFLMQLLSGRDVSVIPSALIGQQAPETKLPPLEGVDLPGLDSSDFIGKVTLVNVWASWCVPCRTESPTLERFYKAHRGPDFTILGIDTNDLTGDASAFLRRYGITYPQLRDGSGDFSRDQLGTTGVPESFLLDPRGRLVLHALGPVSDDYLRSNLLPNLEGRTTG